MAQLRKIVLHVGMPKTASSAIQVWADTNRSAFLVRGVDYPVSKHAQTPKHQTLVSGLKNGNLRYLQALIEGADLPTLFLSAEGLTNHFYDFSASALASFRKHVSGSELVVFLITRDRTAWVKSYWKQCLIVPVIPEFDYGQPFTLSEFSDRPRVRRLADVQQLKLDLATGYGAHRIVDADFCEDWRTRLFQALEIDAADAFTQIGRTHGSISDAAAELVRQINGLGIPNSLRDTFLALLSEVEGDQNLTLLLVRRQYWAKLGQSAGDLEALLDRLEPCNSGEASLIEQLREELARQA